MPAKQDIGRWTDPSHCYEYRVYAYTPGHNRRLEYATNSRNVAIAHAQKIAGRSAGWCKDDSGAPYRFRRIKVDVVDSNGIHVASFAAKQKRKARA